MRVIGCVVVWVCGFVGVMFSSLGCCVVVLYCCCVDVGVLVCWCVGTSVWQYDDVMMW